MFKLNLHISKILRCIHLSCFIKLHFSNPEGSGIFCLHPARAVGQLCMLAASLYYLTLQVEANITNKSAFSFIESLGVKYKIYCVPQKIKSLYHYCPFIKYLPFFVKIYWHTGNFSKAPGCPFNLWCHNYCPCFKYKHNRFIVSFRF